MLARERALLIVLAAATVDLALANPALSDPCTGALPKRGASFTGVVRYVGDADSFCVGQSADPKSWIEVRVADFYGPELHARNELGRHVGREAKETLERLAFGKSAVCTAGRRSWDRVIAVCEVDGTSVGDLMRRAGVVEGGNGR